jgi:hypothetical protein
VNWENFYDLQMTSEALKDVAQSGIDIEFEIDAIPTVRASLSLLDGTAKIGVKATYALFLELEAGIKFPDPYPGLSTSYLDASSFVHLGDCSRPHFMEYNGFAGYGDVAVTMPMSLEIPYIITKSAEPTLFSAYDRHRMSLFSGCIGSVYDAQVMLSTAVSTVGSLSEERQAQLKKIIMWALGLSEIDPNFLTINSISETTGEISIQIAVPPSVAEVYANTYDLENTFYERARTASFASEVSSFVGIGFASQCESGWWGPTCIMQCTSPHCRDGFANCNAVDGTVTSCSYCDDGYWGSTCENYCDVPNPCGGARCDQESGEATECMSCEGNEYWGSMCESACYVPEQCQFARCEQESGATISCDYSCNDGWWGSECDERCTALRCVYGSASCNAYNGIVTWCSSCEDGWWGPTCTMQCISPHCRDACASCNAVDGTVTSCSYCDDGYWGSTCESSCKLPTNCKSARCTQSSGAPTECLSCAAGWKGDLCAAKVTPGSTTTANTGNGTNSGSESGSNGAVSPTTSLFVTAAMIVVWSLKGANYYLLFQYYPPVKYLWSLLACCTYWWAVSCLTTSMTTCYLPNRICPNIGIYGRDTT